MIKRDDIKGEFSLRITDRDDLWFLYQVIGPGVIAGSLTNRKLESKDDQVRADSQPRVKVYLRIEVKETEFHPFSDALRLKGTILEGPPDISGHHTLNVEPGTNLDITKTTITEHDIQLLEEAEKASLIPKALALTIDDESAELFRLREYGLEPLGRIGAGPGGKRYPSKDKWEIMMKEVLELITNNYSLNVPIIVTGPGFFRDVAGKEIRNIPGIKAEDVYVVPSSSVGRSGLKEALTRKEGMEKLLEKTRFARESDSIQLIMSKIAKGKGAAYGLEVIERDLSLGAVELLVITEELFRTDHGKKLLAISSRTGSDHLIISTSHDGGKMLQKLGGAAVLLRFET